MQVSAAATAGIEDHIICMIPAFEDLINEVDVGIAEESMELESVFQYVLQKIKVDKYMAN